MTNKIVPRTNNIIFLYLLLHYEPAKKKKKFRTMQMHIEKANSSILQNFYNLKK